MLSNATLMCRMMGMVGMVIYPSCTFVVTSQTKMFAWLYAVATNTILPSRLMQKQEISGLTASNLLFSGRRKVCLIFGMSPSGFSWATRGSLLASMKTMRLDAT